MTIQNPIRPDADVAYVIEDEEDIAKLIQYNLSLEGFHVECFSSAEAGLKAIQARSPEMIILDLMLPGMDGIELCRRLRGNLQTAQIPIIMVTAKGEESDVVKGLEVGADDYVSKPFSPKVLVARVKAALRKSSSLKKSPTDIVEIHELFIHPGRFEVKFKGEKINLTRSEFQILHYLAQRPGWVFTRSQIVDAVRGENYAVTERSIDVQIVGLRKKLLDGGAYVETVRGVGYRFKE